MSGMIGSASKTLRVQEFRSSGTYTVPAGVKTVRLFLIGGGGAGATSSNPGIGGMVNEFDYDVSGKSSCAVVIGAGGVQPQGPGGDTTFDGVATAYGGSGNGSATALSYATGRLGFGGAGVIAGQPGLNGAVAGAAGRANTGAGGGIASNGGSGYCRVEWYE